MPDRAKQFDEALSSASNVTKERGEIYGHPYDQFGRIARIQGVTAACPDPRVRHALDMIAVKMTRLIQTPDHIDSLIDIAGYARTVAMVLDREEEIRATGGTTNEKSPVVHTYRWTVNRLGET